MAIGSDVLVQIFDSRSIWPYCNDSAAEYLGQPRDWFPGRSPGIEMPSLMRDWSNVIQTVSHARETYIDRSHRGLLNIPKPDEQNITWSVLAFPITLHDGRAGVVLTARILDKTPTMFA